MHVSDVGKFYIPFIVLMNTQSRPEKCWSIKNKQFFSMFVKNVDILFVKNVDIVFVSHVLM